MKLVRGTNDVVGLMEIGVDLMETLGDLTGLYVGFHRDVMPGIRLHVNTGRPVTSEVAELDRIALLLGAEIEATFAPGVAIHTAKGSWKEVPVEVTQLSAERDADDARSLLRAAELAPVIRDVAEVARRIDPTVLTTVMVKDFEGAPRGHLVLESTDHRGALRSVFEGFPTLEGVSREDASFATFLTSAGLPITVASIDCVDE